MNLRDANRRHEIKVKREEEQQRLKEEMERHARWMEKQQEIEAKRLAERWQREVDRKEMELEAGKMVDKMLTEYGSIDHADPMEYFKYVDMVKKIIRM